MHRISLITTTFGLALLVSVTGFAADQYTYRAGQAYMKTAAIDYTQCEAQCQGDAACQGWNFVRPSPRSRSGMCEFNASKVAPVSSPVSISGDNNTGVDALMSNVAPLTENMSGNTVRAGTPIVYRMPVPVAGQTLISANYSRTIPVQQASVQRDVTPPRIYGGEAPQIQTQGQLRQEQKLRQGLVQPRQMTQQQIYHQQILAAQQVQAQIRMQRQADARMPQQRMPRRFAPPYQIPQQAPMMPTQAPYAPNPYAQRMLPQAQNQASLNGHLYDNLTKNMTAIPRPQTAPDQVENPNAPLSTSRAMPTRPVNVAPLGYPAVPGLAGG